MHDSVSLHGGPCRENYYCQRSTNQSGRKWRKHDLYQQKINIHKILHCETLCRVAILIVNVSVKIRNVKTRAMFIPVKQISETTG